MASVEHVELASYIKMVHQDLRNESRKLGFETAWKQHCKQQGKLDKYASSMLSLATKHWDENLHVAGAVECRIKWVHQQCNEYFLLGGMRTQRVKERHKLIAYKYVVLEDELTQDKLENEKRITENSATSLLNLLDVGSCYNPFQKYDIFRVLPIDIAPGNCEVKKSDFLKIHIVPEQVEWWESSSSVITTLSKHSFEVIVFSLLLEYFPNPELRFTCCSKAYDLLKTEGLLFIITPDSKHATANAPIMKKWRIALATLGFWRVSYEKLKHLHCMAFCKSRYPDFPKLWSAREVTKCSSCIDKAPQLMVIPQDLNPSVSKTSYEDSTRLERNSEVIVDMFEELPLCVV